MSTLYLIRHGQASFGAEDYDVLSPRGIEQSRALGRHIAGRPVAVDAIYAGPRRRQLDTARHMAEAAAELGCPAREIAVVPELDEYPAIELFRAWLPRLAAEDGPLARSLGNLAAGGAPPSSESVQAAFEHITHRWARGELDTGDLESFHAFSVRVERGVRSVMAAEGRGRRIALVTSGGPISIAVRLGLGLSEEKTIRLSWVIANASVTELRWRGDELSLFGFNATHHLAPDLVTFR
ncbi:MAG TPA: histidine phosphatase family protein [Kofleriaceae bacterium]|nr:histidine phosphatase family protein [Kofleriaceae bacterium]